MQYTNDERHGFRVFLIAKNNYQYVKKWVFPLKIAVIQIESFTLGIATR